MEASVPTREDAPPGASASVPYQDAPPGGNARAQTAEQANYGRLFSLMILVMLLGSVLGMYLVIGYAIYALITALV